jgi:hypothetical protein
MENETFCIKIPYCTGEKRDASFWRAITHLIGITLEDKQHELGDVMQIEVHLMEVEI